jgi:hypothetical protein
VVRVLLESLNLKIKVLADLDVYLAPGEIAVVHKGIQDGIILDRPRGVASDHPPAFEGNRPILVEEPFQANRREKCI